MPSTPEQPYLELLPAVDIKGGQAVQLVQGVDGSEKRFGDPSTPCTCLLYTSDAADE